MRTLRAIGGIADGKTMSVNGDRVVVPVLPKLKNISLSPTDPMEPVTIEKRFYKIGGVYGPRGQEVLFLMPENWTDHDALNHMLFYWRPA